MHLFLHKFTCSAGHDDHNPFARAINQPPVFVGPNTSQANSFFQHGGVARPFGPSFIICLWDITL